MRREGKEAWSRRGENEAEKSERENWKEKGRGGERAQERGKRGDNGHKIQSAAY